MYRRDDAFVLLRAGDGEHLREAVRNRLGLGPHAAGDDHLAVLGQGLANGPKRLLLGAVEKPAGVDDDEISAVVLARELVALGAQARNDALGIDQRFRAAERDKADFRPARRRGWCIDTHINPYFDLESVRLFVDQRLSDRVE